MYVTSNIEQANVATEAARAVAAYKITHGYEPAYTKLYWCVANEVGIPEAALIQVIESWCMKNASNNKRGYFHDGYWWTAATYSVWAEKHPAFGSARSVQRLFLSLEEKGYIISSQPLKTSGNNCKFYRVDAAKIGSLIIHDANSGLSMMPKMDDVIYTEQPIVPNSDGIVPNSDDIVPNSDEAPSHNPLPERVSGSLLDQETILVNQITAVAGEKDMKNLEEERKETFNAKPIPNELPPVVKKSKDCAADDKTRTEDTLCGAARENDSQFLGFSDDPIKEPDFLGYYRSYQKTQGKEIKNVASYVATILSKRDEGSSEVELLFKEWQAACRAVERKINNFADNSEQIKRQRQKFGFESWEEWKHHVYYERLLSEGLAKFRTHEVSARWYEWALAKYPDRFADIPV